MKLFLFATSLVAVSICEAFSPLYNGVHPTAAATTTIRRTTHQILKAETLEGWKIDGRIIPVNNFILIKKAEDQKQTETGILLSKTVRASVRRLRTTIQQNMLKLYFVPDFLSDTHARTFACNTKHDNKLLKGQNSKDRGNCG
jgi:hypothetical protein